MRLAMASNIIRRSTKRKRKKKWNLLDEGFYEQCKKEWCWCWCWMITSLFLAVYLLGSVSHYLHSLSGEPLTWVFASWSKACPHPSLQGETHGYKVSDFFGWDRNETSVAGQRTDFLLGTALATHPRTTTPLVIHCFFFFGQKDSACSSPNRPLLAQYFV
jgi:hypothetical protein